jgi:hypothetical protein
MDEYRKAKWEWQRERTYLLGLLEERKHIVAHYSPPTDDAETRVVRFSNNLIREYEMALKIHELKFEVIELKFAMPKHMTFWQFILNKWK